MTLLYRRALLAGLTLTPVLLPRKARAEQLHPLTEATRSKPPKPLPAAKFATLDGKVATLAPYLGRIVVLNFWATWCPPCVAELPALDTLAALAPDITVLAASSDHGGADVVRPFATAHAITHLTLLLDAHGAIGRNFDVQGFPTTLIIDRLGLLRATMVGPAAWDTEAAGIRALCS